MHANMQAKNCILLLAKGVIGSALLILTHM